jgi:hypothetical protein
MATAYEGLSSNLQVVAFWGMLGLILSFGLIRVLSGLVDGCKICNYQHLLLPAFAAACFVFAPKESIVCVGDWWSGFLGLLSVLGHSIVNWVLAPTGGFLVSVGRFLFLESFWGIPVIAFWGVAAVAAYFLPSLIGDIYTEVAAKRLTTEDEWYDSILSSCMFIKNRTENAIMMECRIVDPIILKRLSAAYARLLLRSQLSIPQEFLKVSYPSFVKAFGFVAEDGDEIANAFIKAGVGVELSEKVRETLNNGIRRCYDRSDRDGLKRFIEECHEFRKIWESYVEPQKPAVKSESFSMSARWCRKSTEFVGNVFGFIGTCFKVVGYGFVAIWVTLKSWKQGVCAYRKFEH